MTRRAAAGDVEKDKTLVFRRNGDDRIEVDPARAGVIIRIADYKDRAQFVLTLEEAAAIGQLLARVSPAPQPVTLPKAFVDERKGQIAQHVTELYGTQPVASVGLEQIADATVDALWNDRDAYDNRDGQFSWDGVKRHILAALQRARETGAKP